jgi:hypothetical protein
VPRRASPADALEVSDISIPTIPLWWRSTENEDGTLVWSICVQQIDAFQLCSMNFEQSAKSALAPKLQ